MNITFRQLRVFVEVARLGSMARAAESLHLTPPAVSMHIREIETQVGLLLFDREGRRLSLSTAGEYFLVHARKLLGQLQEADHAMARLKHLEQGSLTIGIVSAAAYFVPHLLARFQQEHPGVSVGLRVAANREQLVGLMHAADVDLSVMGRAPKDLAARAEPFAANPLVFIGAPQHPAARLGHAPATVLAPYPFVAREHGSGTRAAMQSFFADHQIAPPVAMELAGIETIKHAVMAGLGLSFLSVHTMGLELRGGLLRVLDVTGTPVMRVWNVVHLSSRVLSPSAEAFRYFILEHGEAHLRAHDAGLIG